MCSSAVSGDNTESPAPESEASSQGAIADVIPPEMIQLWLIVAGWLVAFLLGKELATGFTQWRARRTERGPRRNG